MNIPQCPGSLWNSELIIRLTNVKALSKSSEQAQFLFFFSFIVHGEKENEALSMFPSADGRQPRLVCAEKVRNSVQWKVWLREIVP